MNTNKRKLKDKLINLNILPCILTAIVLNLIIECFARFSAVEGIKFLFSNPLMFFYNSMIILCTLTISLLFKKKSFFMFIISTVWIIFGVSSLVLLGYRSTPLMGIDFKLLKTSGNILNMYLTPFEVFSIIFLILITIFVLYKIYKKTKKTELNFMKAFLTFFITIAATLSLTFGFLTTGILSDNIPHLGEAYKKYGFAYCFSATCFDRGVDEPDNYSKETVIAIKDDIENNLPEKEMKENPIYKSFEDDDWPNIVYVQLESFFDITHIKGLSFSEDPIPNFSYIRDNYSNGYMSVNLLGAGTANTEFEVLTGVNLDFFGPGEYPYTTILKEHTCESINYNMKELHDYSSHAIHNHTGTFYDRHLAYGNIGFNTFTSKEYMNNLSYNPMGWENDDILTSQIIKALNSTDTKDIVFAVSVQGHGKYPEEIIDDNRYITIEGCESEEQKNSYEYYTEQARQMDEFAGDLINTLEQSSEPCIVVFYGDHLPGFFISNEDLTSGDVLKSEYVIWHNSKADYIIDKDVDLQTYQVSARVTEMLGINGGLINTLNQEYLYDDFENKEYQRKLELLEHDILYGEKTAYNGLNPYKKCPLKMGISQTKIRFTRNKIDDINEAFIFGNGFTKDSHVFINDDEQDTIFISPTILKITEKYLEAGDRITVKYLSVDKETLSETNQYIVE